MPRTGRPREFDEEQTLAGAQELFWSRGYAATSVQDLVDELAVQRGSLYAAFGDKRSFYLRAVSRYARQNRESLEAVLAEGPVLSTLRRILTDPSTLTGADAGGGGGGGRRLGCLIGNTTAELVPDDEAAHALVSEAYDGFLEVVAAAFRRAQADGEVTAAATPEAQAQLVLLLFQGSALVSRARSGAGYAGIHAALDALAAVTPATAKPR